MSETQVANIRQILERNKVLVAMGVIGRPRIINPNVDLEDLETQANTFTSTGTTELPVIEMSEMGRAFHEYMGRDNEDGEDFNYTLFYDATFAVYAPTVSPEIALVRQDARGEPRPVRRTLVPIWENKQTWKKGETPLFVVAFDLSREDVREHMMTVPTGCVRVDRVHMDGERQYPFDSILKTGLTKYGHNSKMQRETEKRMEHEQYGEKFCPGETVNFVDSFNIDAIGSATIDFITYGPSMTEDDFVVACKRYVDLFEKTLSNKKPLAWKKPVSVNK